MDEAEDRIDKSKEANKARQKRKKAQQVRQAVLHKYLYKGSETSIRGRFRDPAVEMRTDGRRRTRNNSR
jgi:hypothetical protein